MWMMLLQLHVNPNADDDSSGGVRVWVCQRGVDRIIACQHDHIHLGSLYDQQLIASYSYKNKVWERDLF